jgi:predicted RNA-binding protein with PIN domain
MRKQIYILDGYNLIHRIPRWEEHLDTSLERGREVLIAYCRRWLQTRGDVWLFYIVFDGDSSVGTAHSSSGPGIRVVYSRTGQTADDKILDIVHEFGDGCSYVVVSDDRYVTHSAHHLEAGTMSAADFAAVLSAGSAPPSRKKGRGKVGHPDGDTDSAARDNTAGKVSPHDAKRITDSLRREWNV